MLVNVLEKVAPQAAKIGTKTLIEIVGLASIGGGVVNFGLDKACDKLHKIVNESLEKKKRELEIKKAAIQAQKEAEDVVAEEVQEVEVVETKNTSKKKKNK